MRGSVVVAYEAHNLVASVQIGAPRMALKSEKSWSVPEEEKLKNLYLNTSLTLIEIGEKIGRTAGALNNRLTKIGVPRRLSPFSKIPKRITPALARIHAHVCGDGHLTSYEEKDDHGYWAKYRKNPLRIRYVIGYDNNNEDLLNEFQEDMYEVFGVMGNRYKNTIKVKSK